jgi:hypothetical protein
MSAGFEHVGFEESVWLRPKGRKYGEDIYVSTHVDDCLICCKSGYAERVLRTFGMWDCNPVLTPLDPNVRLTKRDSPEVVDPRLHRRMRSIVGCLSYQTSPPPPPPG